MLGQTFVQMDIGSDGHWFGWILVRTDIGLDGHWFGQTMVRTDIFFPYKIHNGKKKFLPLICFKIVLLPPPGHKEAIDTLGDQI